MNTGKDIVRSADADCCPDSLPLASPEAGVPPRCPDRRCGDCSLNLVYCKRIDDYRIGLCLGCPTPESEGKELPGASPGNAALSRPESL